MTVDRIVTMACLEDDPLPTGMRNHGQPWTPSEYRALHTLWDDPNMSLQDICNRLGRSRKSIACKAESLGLVVLNRATNEYRTNPHRRRVTNVNPDAIYGNTLYENPCKQIDIPEAPSLCYGGTITSARIPHKLGDASMYAIANTAATQTLKIQEPTQMHANIETKTFINGIEAANLTDSQIFQRIAKLEGEIKALEDIKTKSVKKNEAIEALKADIKAMVDYVDNR